MSTADIVCADALEMLADMSDDAPAIFTSLPDASEIDLPVPEWRDWFYTAARRTLAATDDHGYTLFYQTDRKYDGALESKAGLLHAAAQAVGARLVFHKIAFRTYGTDLFRPGYTHFVGYSRKGPPGRATPDVYQQGPKAYPDATDEETCRRGITFLISQGVPPDLLDPFCGRGSILLYAMREGFDVYGIDIDPDQVRATCDLLGQPALL